MIILYNSRYINFIYWMPPISFCSIILLKVHEVNEENSSHKCGLNLKWVRVQDIPPNIALILPSHPNPRENSPRSCQHRWMPPSWLQSIAWKFCQPRIILSLINTDITIYLPPEGCHPWWGWGSPHPGSSWSHRYSMYSSSASEQCPRPHSWLLTLVLYFVDNLVKSPYSRVLLYITNAPLLFYCSNDSARRTLNLHLTYFM